MVYLLLDYYLMSVPGILWFDFVLDFYLMSEQVFFGLPCGRFLSNVRTSILWFDLC